VHARSGDAEQTGERERRKAGWQAATRDRALRQTGSVRDESSFEQDPQVLGDVLGDALDQAAHVQKTGGRSRIGRRKMLQLTYSIFIYGLAVSVLLFVIAIVRS